MTFYVIFRIFSPVDPSEREGLHRRLTDWAFSTLSHSALSLVLPGTVDFQSTVLYQVPFSSREGTAVPGCHGGTCTVPGTAGIISEDSVKKYILNGRHLLVVINTCCTNQSISSISY